MHAIGELTVVSGLDVIWDTVLTQFSFDVLYNGDFNRVFGTILYEDDELRIDNPFTRSRLIVPWSDYDKVDGDLQAFVVQKCREMLETQWSDDDE